jgi:hypothetical protein
MTNPRSLCSRTAAGASGWWCSASLLLLILVAAPAFHLVAVEAFSAGVPSPFRTGMNSFAAHCRCAGGFKNNNSHKLRMGYLDDITQYTKDPDEEKEEDDSREATNMNKDQVDRYGPGSLQGFVDFNEFDGGDGRTFLVLCSFVLLTLLGVYLPSFFVCEWSWNLYVLSMRLTFLSFIFFAIYYICIYTKTEMGVAGDGSKGLDKEWKGQAELGKSKTMSAKNAWGKSTGYANELIDQGMEATRAQQMENWRNQREVVAERNQHRWLTDDFDNTSKKGEQDWRTLSSFAGERVQDDVNLDQEFGEVVPGPETGTIELRGRLNQFAVHEFAIKNPFMGFSDFRARFTGMNNPSEWSVSPTEGSLNGRGDPTQFTVKFRGQSPTVSEGYLVVQTEDDKWTYKLIGITSM